MESRCDYKLLDPIYKKFLEKAKLWKQKVEAELFGVGSKRLTTKRQEGMIWGN